MLIEKGDFMIKILRMTDRVKLKIGKVTFFLAPLMNDHKMEMASTVATVSGEKVIDYGQAQHLYLKYALKDLQGVTDYHGEKYELEFEGDYLTDECISEVSNLSQKDELMGVAWQIFQGLPNKIVDPNGKEYKKASLEVMKVGDIKV